LISAETTDKSGWRHCVDGRHGDRTDGTVGANIEGLLQKLCATDLSRHHAVIEDHQVYASRQIVAADGVVIPSLIDLPGFGNRERLHVVKAGRGMPPP
jgi:hypothetical protein